MINQISTDEVKELIDNGTDKVILDVREAREVAFGKIPGSINIPLGLIPVKYQELDKSKEYIIVCLSGGRSMSAANFLQDQGFKVENMTGGMTYWEWKLETVY